MAFELFAGSLCSTCYDSIVRTDIGKLAFIKSI